MSDYLLTQVINYGSPLFGLILFSGALGIPVPSSITLIAVGAFAQQGVIAWYEAAIFGLAGAVLGDSASFGIGYFARDWVNARFGASPTWKNARDAFDSRADLAVYLTRFLITSLALPTNLIAGGSGIRFRRFLTYDTLGEITWVILYGGLGYWFGTQWELVSNFISNFGGLLLGVVLLVGGIWLGVRQLAKRSPAPKSS